MPPNTINVTRPSRWCNPFRIGMHYQNMAILVMMYNDLSYKQVKKITNNFSYVWVTSRKKSLQLYERYLKVLINTYGYKLSELKDKNLACWCKLSDECHADILLKLANQ